MTGGLTRRAGLCGALAAAAAAAPAQPGAAEEGDRPARLARTVEFDLGGRADRAPWRIFLHVPAGEAPAGGWPALYLLDGNAVIGTAVDIQRVQSPYPGGTGIASPFVVIGIGYPIDGAYDSVRRSWDYGPPPGRTYPPHSPNGPEVRTGGAGAFLDFLRSELKPAIARRCPIDPGREALFGHSFGGLFTLYALGEAPDTFATWIAASPTIYWEDFVLLRSIERLEARRDLHERVLLCAGEYEDRLAPFQEQAADRERRIARLERAKTVALARDMADRLGRVPGLEVEFRSITGRTHMSMLPEAVNDGVSFAFGPRAPGGSMRR